MYVDKMKITNSSGDSITFGRHFCLYDHFDLSGLVANVNYADSTADGATYQRTRLDIREFDLPFYIDRKGRADWWIEEQRILAYKVFNPKKNPLRIDITTPAGKEYYLHANLQGAPFFPTELESENELFQDGLLQFTANDPYIYESTVQSVDVATWIGAFEFPLEIPEEGIEMGYREESLIANVKNDGQESTGMLIRFRANGTVVNPSLINVNTYEEFKLNYTMLGGDVIEVSTYPGRKTITLIRNNVRSSIFHARQLLSKFLQLEVGDNLFRYDAENGQDGLNNLEIQIQFTPRLIGV